MQNFSPSLPIFKKHPSTLPPIFNENPEEILLKSPFYNEVKWRLDLDLILIHFLVQQGFIIGLTIFLFIQWWSFGWFLQYAIYAGDGTLPSKHDWTSDLWQHPELAFKLESDLEEFLDGDKKWLINFNAKKNTELILFGCSGNLGDYCFKNV